MTTFSKLSQKPQTIQKRLKIKKSPRIKGVTISRANLETLRKNKVKCKKRRCVHAPGKITWPFCFSCPHSNKKPRDIGRMV